MKCEHCGVGLALSPRISVEMKPGKDGQPWWLCVRCWSEGARYKPDVPMTATASPSAQATPAQKVKRKRAS